jgi:tellurite resistance protein TehA-like permease
LIHKLREAIEGLFPGYFALVMATGIVSLAAHFLEMDVVAWPLFWLNNIFYVVLVALTLARIVLAPRRVANDLVDHQTGPTFLTIVAGTCVLGTQYQVMADASDLALALGLAGLALWLVLIYTFFTSVTVREDKPTLDKGLNGAWLLAVVSTQSLSVLGTLLAPRFSGSADLVLFFTLCQFLLGCMLYLLIITLIFYRFTFFKLAASELTPPYWINMGAVAITTMAGARLLLQAGSFGLLEEMRPFLKGFTLFFWATATWWIPLLLILGDWRHVVKRVPFAYHPAYWSMVFPLGMYTAATFQLGRALSLPFLLAIPAGFIYVALGAWLVMFVLMVLKIGSAATSKRRGASA